MRVKMMGLCLVAVFAIAAVASASALASQPELLNSKGEKLKSPLSFTSGSREGPSEFHIGGESKFDCNKSTSMSGEFINSTEVRHVVAKWAECKTGAFGPNNCTAGSGGAATITSESLKGKLGLISSAGKHEVGLELEAEAEHEQFGKKVKGPWVNKLECQEWWHGNIAGELIGRLTPINGFASKKVELVYSQTGGTQYPSKFEGGLENQVWKLEPYNELGMALADSRSLTFPSEVKIVG